MKRLDKQVSSALLLAGMCMACSSITEGDVGAGVTSIDELNQQSEKVNSHQNECFLSSLELNYRTLQHVGSPTLSATNAQYPRIKKLANGTYLLIYQNNRVAWNVYYALSDDLVTWKNASQPLFGHESARRESGEKDTRCFSSCDAVVLSNGDILSFVAFRLNKGYRTEPQHNGIMMKRSKDHGVTWSEGEIIYQGTTWEPYALELRSGEIQVYFTDAEPLKGDSGTSMLRSLDGGRTWTYVGKIIRQVSGVAKDGSGVPIYSDQMPVARELNDSKTIAVATEARFDNIFHVSMAWNGDNWESAPLTGNEVGPQKRDLNFVEHAAAPYLVQFPSGETVLSYNASSLFTMRMGNTEATGWGEPYRPFTGKGYWGMMEIVGSHALVATMPSMSVDDEKGDVASLQIGRFVLNHAVKASSMTPRMDGNNVDWKKVDEALFIGSESPTQTVFRFSYDADKVYCLVERQDSNLASGDNFDLLVKWREETADVLKISLLWDSTQGKVVCSVPSVVCESTMYGTLDVDDTDEGYVAEVAIPRSLLGGSGDRMRFNAVMYDGHVTDTFTGLTDENDGRWLPVILSDKE